MKEIYEGNEYVYGIIYKYTNKINGKSYIGQTIHQTTRYSRHKQASDNSYFHNAIRKYGFENFEYSVLFAIKCPKEYYKEILDNYEKFYIKEYKSLYTENGYNIDKGGHLGGRRKRLCLFRRI